MPRDKRLAWASILTGQPLSGRPASPAPDDVDVMVDRLLAAGAELPAEPEPWPRRGLLGLAEELRRREAEVLDQLDAVVGGGNDRALDAHLLYQRAAEAVERLIGLTQTAGGEASTDER